MSEFTPEEEARRAAGLDYKTGLPLFEGHPDSECGAPGTHRSVGSHRAWCHTCSTWCYPRIDAACPGCELPAMRAKLRDYATFRSDLVFALQTEAETARLSPNGQHPDILVRTHAAALRFAAELVEKFGTPRGD